MERVAGQVTLFFALRAVTGHRFPALSLQSSVSSLQSSVLSLKSSVFSLQSSVFDDCGLPTADYLLHAACSPA